MSTQFVRYTPDIEATEPYFDENLQIVIDKLEEYIAGSVTTEGTGRAVRDAHAKGYGLVKAAVEILGQLPAEYAQGIYAVPGKHGALIRFSNGQPHAGPDMLLGPVAGMALKIFDVNGPTLLEDEPDTGTFDYATINAPVFFCNTVEHYLFIVRIRQQDISGDDNLEKMDALSFTPWRVTAEHSPLGNIMRARKEVYRHASVLRHTLNHQQRKEPSSADEVLP